MKYYKILKLILCLYSSFTFSQNESANWYFGSNAGVNFSSSPPTALLDGEINTREGVATISNSNGQLLFYTDGSKIWDKNHNVTPNGTGLTGDVSSTQSAIIVPKPNNPNIYYIFTVDRQAGSDGLKYSEFDLSLNNGNGDVTNIKNIALWYPTSEKITAVEHLNGIDFWVITHEWGSSNFVTFKVTPTGVDLNPILQSIGSTHQGFFTFSTLGYMKIAPNGQRLAIAKYSSDSFVEVFDFNNSTGVLSNPILIEDVFYQGLFRGAYGVEFSTNSQLLYVSDLASNSNSYSKVHQFNLELGNQTDIINSDIILYEGTDFMGAIQMASDGKLYLANKDFSYLDVIENPNSIGLSANYLNREIYLNEREAKFGLPTFIQSFFFDIIEYDNSCSNQMINFSINTNEDIATVLWDFGDGFTSDTLNPSHIYDNSGTYTVSVNISFMNQITRTATREIIIYDAPTANTVSDYQLCDDISNDQIETFDLSSKISEVMGSQSGQIFNVAFYESFEDAENDENRLSILYNNNSNNQEVFVRIYNIQYESCYAITSFLLNVNPYPIANNVDDIRFCDEQDNDGSILLNITQFNTAILQNQSSDDFIISYHLTQNEVDNGINSLPNDFQTIDNPQSIFVRITSIENAECYDTTDFEIYVDEALQIGQVDDLYECENSINSGIAVFDLTFQSQQITSNLVGTFDVRYFQTEQDALMNLNMLSTTYTNTTNPELLYARIQDVTNQSCFDIVEFNIHVLESPNVDDSETLYLCTDETIVLQADTGFDYYLWSTGESTQNITINEPGIYTVEIGNSYNYNTLQNCITTKTITVIESGAAANIEIDIVDWTTSQNTILIIVDGLGDYEYSLNGINYSDLNFFENLTPNEYTVYVRDKNNCGVITQSVFLLNYPHFFTPNNDGINDNWQVILSREDPSLKISIYDRYGKKLTSINPSSVGWDGNYNGRPMPSGDYWFKVERPSTGRTYKGNFTLKR